MSVKLGRIKEAVQIAEQALADTLTLIKAGVREKDIARRLYQRIRFHGGDGTSFRTIIASGRRSTNPHGRATDKKIKPGDTVVVDFGARYKGFCSDMTRSFVVGSPSAKQKMVYRILLNAQKKAIESIADGVSASKVDEAARDYIKSKNFGRYFIHSTGHGVGRRIHEAPKISFKNKKSILRSGMIITIEPGIYIKGWGGMRIEDMVLVTKSGCKLLTKSPKGRLAV